MPSGASDVGPSLQARRGQQLVAPPHRSGAPRCSPVERPPVSTASAAVPATGPPHRDRPGQQAWGRVSWRGPSSASVPRPAPRVPLPGSASDRPSRCGRPGSSPATPTPEPPSTTTAHEATSTDTASTSSPPTSPERKPLARACPRTASDPRSRTHGAAGRDENVGAQLVACAST
jgi:hypothetical protein